MAIAQMKEYDFNKLLHMQPCKLGHNTWLRGETGKNREIVYHESPIPRLPQPVESMSFWYKLLLVNVVYAQAKWSTAQ